MVSKYNMLKHLLVLILALTSDAVFAQADIAAIKASRTASNEAIARHDADALSANLLPDFTITRGNGTIEAGREAIIASWKELFKANPTVSYVRNPTNIIINDDGVMAWETGEWKAKNSYSKGGNYAAMWRKIDGVWKLQSELFVALHKL